MDEKDLAKFLHLLMLFGTATAARDMSFSLWLLMCCGRSDDGRLIFLFDVIKPRLMKCIGNYIHSPNILIAAIYGST